MSRPDELSPWRTPLYFIMGKMAINKEMTSEELDDIFTPDTLLESYSFGMYNLQLPIGEKVVLGLDKRGVEFNKLKHSETPLNVSVMIIDASNKQRHYFTGVIEDAGGVSSVYTHVNMFIRLHDDCRSTPHRERDYDVEKEAAWQFWRSLFWHAYTIVTTAILAYLLVK